MCACARVYQALNSICKSLDDCLENEMRVMLKVSVFPVDCMYICFV